MVDFQKELEKWFVDMGYPIESVKDTDWKIMCCGRLPEYWKSVMSSTRSKQEVTNILRNFALKEIKVYDQKKYSSAAKIGTLIPPPQIYYPKEQERLRKELDLLKLKLSSKKHDYKSVMDERKRKCYELHVLKQEIKDADRQIFAMKETRHKLENDLILYKNKSELANKYKNNFINDFPECDHLKMQHQIDIEQLVETYLQNEKLTNKSDVKEEDDVINNMRTSELSDLIISYQKSIPQLMENKISQIYLNKYENASKYKSMKDNLTEMKLFHCKVVIATMQLKKECQRAKLASDTIKSKTLEGLDMLKVELFNQECSRVCDAAYIEAFLQELSDLKAGLGLYGSLTANLNSDKSSDTEILQKSINNMKERYTSLYLKSQNEIKNIRLQMEIIKQTNSSLKNTIIEIKKSRNDKVLWHPDYKQIQDKYLKIVLKNPSLLKTESDNPFACLAYLLTIITDYNINDKLMKCKETNLKQILWYKDVLKDGVVDDLKRKEIDELYSMELDQNWNQNKYIKSLYCVLYAIVRKLKFKNALEDIKVNYQSSREIDDILGNYSDYDYLESSEEKLILQTSQFLKKSHNTSKIDSIVDDFNAIYKFFNDFQMMRKLNNEKSF